VAATAIILPLDMTNHLALIKTSGVTNIAGVSLSPIIRPREKEVL